MTWSFFIMFPEVHFCTKPLPP